MIYRHTSKPLRIQREHLDSFWEEFGKPRTTSQQDWYLTIAALQRAGEIVFVYVDSKLTPAKKRAKFDKVKNKRSRYKTKGAPCFACGEAATVRHHIIWLKNGGINSKRNICFLCVNCHSKIHPWLQVSNDC